MNLFNSIFLAVLVMLCPGNTTRAEVFEWPQATAEEVDIDPGMISELVSAIDRGDYGRLKSLLILRHGRLVHEQYFNGYRQDELMPLYSVSKSWASALVGIGINREELPGVNTPIDEIFTSYPGISSGWWQSGSCMAAVPCWSSFGQRVGLLSEKRKPASIAGETRN